MRYLTIVRDLHIRGTQRAAVTYTIELHQLGVEVAVMTIHGDGPNRSNLETFGIPIFSFQKTESMCEAKLFDADVIHIHRKGSANLKETEILMSLKNEKTKILETNVFGIYDSTLPDGLIDAHLQISATTLARWTQWKGKSNQLGILLPNPVRSDIFYPMGKTEIIAEKRKIGVPKNGFVYGVIGYKISPIILKTFEKILKLHPETYLLICPGNDPNNSKHLNAAKTKRNIISTGEVTNDAQLNKLYNTVDCILHAPKHGETFGYVLAEAQLTTTPVVTLASPNRDNAQTETLTNELGGYVTLSAIDFLRAAIRIKEHHEKEKKSSELARKKVALLYDSKLVTEKLFYILEIFKNYPRHMNTFILDADSTLVTSNGLTCHQRLSFSGLVDNGLHFISSVKRKIHQSKFMQRIRRFIRYNESLF